MMNKWLFCCYPRQSPKFLVEVQFHLYIDLNHHSYRVYISTNIGFHSPCIYNRRKFRSETSDNMDNWKNQRWEESEGRREEERRSERRKSEKKEDAGPRKGRKVTIHCVFPMICGFGGSNLGSLKRLVRSQLARWEMENCTPLRGEAHFQVRKLKTPHVRTIFECWDVKKSGAKHISNSKCTKHTHVGPLLQVEMSKKCTPLWREAHFQVKSVKIWRVRTTFWRSNVEKSARHCSAKNIWKSKVSKTVGLGPFLTFRSDVEKVHTNWFN